MREKWLKDNYGYVGVTNIFHDVLKSLPLEKQNLLTILMRDWKNIVGAELAAITLPKQLKSSKNQKTLVLECEDEPVTLQMREPEILRAIHRFTGNKTIDRLQYVRSYRKKQAATQKQKPQVKNSIVPNLTNASELEKSLREIERALQ